MRPISVPPSAPILTSFLGDLGQPRPIRTKSRGRSAWCAFLSGAIIFLTAVEGFSQGTFWNWRANELLGLPSVAVAVPRPTVDSGSDPIALDTGHSREPEPFRGDCSYTLNGMLNLRNDPGLSYGRSFTLTALGPGWTFSLGDGLSRPLSSTGWRVAFSCIDLFGVSKNPFRSGQGVVFLLHYELGKHKRSGLRPSLLGR